MNFARRVFFICGIYGLLAIVPQFFLEEKNGRDFPPAINHPEFYYGFQGVALAWQILFLILARDPVRYRVMMIPGVLEKLGFGIAAVVLFSLNRAPTLICIAGVIDLIMAVLFFIAYLKTPDKYPTPV
jgi:hypothetical protein